MMRVMKIANAKDVKGGITSVVDSLIEGISNKGIDIEISRYASYIDSVPPLFRILFSLLAIFKFMMVLNPYQLFHLHSATDGSFYRKTIYTLICKFFGKKVIFHIHGSSFEDFHNKNKFNAWLIKRTLNRVDGIIVLSKQMQGLVLSYCSNTNIWILPNPVTMPDVKELKSQRRKQKKIQLLFMGEIGHRKGIYDLVAAISILPVEVRRKVVLHVCGNNELTKLTTYIQSKDVTNECIVHGWIDGERKKSFLANADIYVLPSYHEGLPVSILEAMAYELPVISTNVGGIPEVVIHNQNGLIVSPGSINELAKSIEKLVTDHELRAAFGQKSKSLVSKHDIHMVSDKLQQIYREVLMV
jgi:glycosyltransferase involved in cell wall biosynthesis